MKAIGKGSLATILAMGLHFARIIIWIAFAGLTVAVVIIPFLPMLIDWAAQHEGVNVDADSFSGSDVIEIFQHFISFGVTLFVINRLLELLKTLRLGSPFVRENAERFRRVGYALLIGEGAKFLLGLISVVIDADIDIEIELMSWIAIAAVFVLSEVFLEGARMKEEQDLTV